MPCVISEYGNRLSRTARHHACMGCGRMLPKGSLVLSWSCWDDGMRVRARLCSDCEGVVYGCRDHGRVYVHQGDERVVEGMCRRCDSFPTCERVEWLRRPHDGWFFGDLGRDGDAVNADSQGRPDMRPRSDEGRAGD